MCSKPDLLARLDEVAQFLGPVDQVEELGRTPDVMAILEAAEPGQGGAACRADD